MCFAEHELRPGIKTARSLESKGQDYAVVGKVSNKFFGADRSTGSAYLRSSVRPFGSSLSRALLDRSSRSYNLTMCVCLSGSAL